MGAQESSSGAAAALPAHPSWPASPQIDNAALLIRSLVAVGGRAKCVCVGWGGLHLYIFPSTVGRLFIMTVYLKQIPFFSPSAHLYLSIQCLPTSSIPLHQFSPVKAGAPLRLSSSLLSSGGPPALIHKQEEWQSSCFRLLLQSVVTCDNGGGGKVVPKLR